MSIIETVAPPAGSSTCRVQAVLEKNQETRTTKTGAKDEETLEREEKFLSRGRPAGPDSAPGSFPGHAGDLVQSEEFDPDGLRNGSSQEILFPAGDGKTCEQTEGSSRTSLWTLRLVQSEQEPASRFV